MLVVTSRASTKPSFFRFLLQSAHIDNHLDTHLDDLIARIQLDPPQIKNEEILLETDDEILNLEGTCDSEGSYDDDGDIEMFAEKEDDELFIADEVLK